MCLEGGRGEVFEVQLACLWLLAVTLRRKKETVETFGPGHRRRGTHWRVTEGEEGVMLPGWRIAAGHSSEEPKTNVLFAR